MKTNLLKIILSLLLISSMVLTLFSCNNEIKEPDETENSDITEEIATKKIYNYKDYDRVKDFEIIQVDDGYRLKFNDTDYYEQEHNYEYWGICLESIDEIYDGLIHGTLSEYTKSEIFDTFPRDENGIVIPDPYNLYVPILPEDCSILDDEMCIIWKGAIYHHSMALTSNKYDIRLGAVVEISILPYDDYNEQLKKETDIVKNYPDSMWMHENGKDSIIYSIEGDKKKQTRYTISNEDKTMFVIENYRYSEEQPHIYNTIAFCVSNGTYFTIHFIGNYFTDGSSPNPEWLFEFDVEKYVPENG